MAAASLMSHRFRLATRYDAEREQEAIAILEDHPEIALMEWPGPDVRGQPFVRGSTALHYAANDGKLDLAMALIAGGADRNAANATWFRSVLSWAAYNARIEAIRLLLAHGARPDALDAVHAAAFGGSTNGAGREQDYVEVLRMLLDAGADIDDRRHRQAMTPLAVASKSGNRSAADFLRARGAART